MRDRQRNPGLHARTYAEEGAESLNRKIEKLLKYRWRLLLAAAIAISTVVKLLHLMWPIIGWHAHRQADTAAIARNFFRTGDGILYPMIDRFGGVVVEMNFPLYPFLVSLLYSVFGLHDFLGRLLSILFSIGTIIGLYQLGSQFYSRRTAVLAASVFAIPPLNMLISSLFMPEAMLLFTIVYGLYFFSRWTNEEGAVNAVMAWFFLSVAILVKMPLYLGLPLLFISRLKFGSWLKPLGNGRLWAFALAILLPAAAWYLHSHHAVAGTGHTFGIWSAPGTGKWSSFRLLLDGHFYFTVFVKSIGKYHLTFFGVLMCMAGLVVAVKFKREQFAAIWLLAGLIYVMLWGNGHLPHPYYQLPLIPPMALLIGRAFDWLIDRCEKQDNTREVRRSFTIAILAAAGILLLSGHVYLRLIQNERKGIAALELAEEVQRISNPDEVIATISGGSPFLLYLSDRKGWIVSCDTLGEEQFIDLRKKNVNLIAGLKRKGGMLEISPFLHERRKGISILVDSQTYFILRLTPDVPDTSIGHL